MKNLLLSIITFYSLSSVAQNVELNSLNEKHKITCEIAMFDSDCKTYEFTGNVNFKTNIIDIVNADKIVYDQNTNEILVTGLSDFSIDGAIEITDKAKKRILKYRLGDRIAYLE